MNNPHQQLIQQIDLMLRARYPLLYIVGVEEEAIEQVLQQLTQTSQTPRQLLLWDIVTGWDDNGTDKGSVMGALSRITKTPENTTTSLVLREIHFILKNYDTEKNAHLILAIKNLTRQLKLTRQTLILTSHTLIIPPEIQDEITFIYFPLPNIQFFDYLIHELIVPVKLNLIGL
ncbi:MAG: hypothetical protein ACKPH9_00160 [Dolichospermum sp.]